MGAGVQIIMSVSKGNELLQELYQRLTGLWYNEGKYKGQPFRQPEVKELLEKILKEYGDEKMKEIAVSLWELTKEEVCELKDNQQVLIYNPITRTYKVEYCDKKCIARNKHVIPDLKYFTFENYKESN